MVQTKISKGMKVLTSWLDACEVEYSVAGSGLTLIGAEGDAIECVVVESYSDHPQGKEIVLLAEDFLSADRSLGLLSFQLLTELAGFGHLTPVDRGEAPERVSHKRDFDLVVFRHREFRAAPNPPASVLSQYDSAVTTAARRFYNRNRNTCRANSYEVEDLKQYALVWCVNFIHKYKMDGASSDENHRLLMAHLKQRFLEFLKLLSKKERNIRPTVGTIRVALYGDCAASPGAGAAEGHCTFFAPQGDSDEEGVKMPAFYIDPNAETEEDPEYVARTSQLNRKSIAGRRKSAAALLRKLLGELTPEERVAKLTEVVDSPFVSHDARRTAIRYLRTYGVQLRDLDEDEDVAGGDAASA